MVVRIVVILGIRVWIRKIVNANKVAAGIEMIGCAGFVARAVEVGGIIVPVELVGRVEAVLKSRTVVVEYRPIGVLWLQTCCCFAPMDGIRNCQHWFEPLLAALLPISR